MVYNFLYFPKTTNITLLYSNVIFAGQEAGLDGRQGLICVFEKDLLG